MSGLRLVVPVLQGVFIYDALIGTGGGRPLAKIGTTGRLSSGYANRRIAEAIGGITARSQLQRPMVPPRAAPGHERPIFTMQRALGSVLSPGLVKIFWSSAVQGLFRPPRSVPCSRVPETEGCPECGHPKIN